MSNYPLFGLHNARLVTISDRFETVGTITAAGTTLAVAGRSWDDVEDYFTNPQSTYLAYVIPNVWNALEVRMQGETDGHSNVVEVWGARGEDHFTLLATLTTTVGTQEGDDGLLFIDSITATTENLPKDGTVCDNAANNICRYVVDMAGYSRLLFIATTLNSASLKIEASGY